MHQSIGFSIEHLPGLLFQNVIDTKFHPSCGRLEDISDNICVDFQIYLGHEYLHYWNQFKCVRMSIYQKMI